MATFVNRFWLVGVNIDIVSCVSFGMTWIIRGDTQHCFERAVVATLSASTASIFFFQSLRKSLEIESILFSHNSVQINPCVLIFLNQRYRGKELPAIWSILELSMRTKGSNQRTNMVQKCVKGKISFHPTVTKSIKGWRIGSVRQKFSLVQIWDPTATYLRSKGHLIEIDLSS